MRLTQIDNHAGVYGSLELKKTIPDKPQTSVIDSREFSENQEADFGKNETAGKPQQNRTGMSLEETVHSFPQNSSFDLIGIESNLEKLDIKKAISDMQKDKMLQEYQYFIRTKPNTETDGTVIKK